MKSLVLIVALALFLKPIFPVVDYLVNYEYISKVLCENKAKPELHCNGKCHLMKELAKVAEEDKPVGPEKKAPLHETEVLFFQEVASLIPRQTYFQYTTTVTDSYSNFYFHWNSCSVFHPPAVLA